MVKHARRSHAPGGGVMGESDDEDDESPTTPNSHSPWDVPYGYWPGAVQQHRALAPHNVLPMRNFQRLGSLGSNGPEYNPHGDYSQADMVRRLSQQGHLTQQGQIHNADMGRRMSHPEQFSQQQRPLPLPAQRQAQQGPIYKIDYEVDAAYHSKQPRTVDVHVQPPSLQDSPSSFSAPSPAESGPSDAYTHQPAQAASHALHNAGQGPQQQMNHYPYAQSMMPQHQQYQPPATQAIYDQHYQTSGPMTTSAPMSSGPMNMNVSAYGEAGLTAFSSPMVYYSLGNMNMMPDIKVEGHMMLPQQRFSAM